MLSGEYKVTFVLNPLEENPDYENNTGDADTSDPDQTDGTSAVADAYFSQHPFRPHEHCTPSFINVV